MRTDDALSLTRAVQLVEWLRDVKDLERHHAQLYGAGDVSGLLDLYTEDAVLYWGAEERRGRPAIGDWLQQDVAKWSGDCAMRFAVIDQPLVNLTQDATHATGRWQGLRFLADGQGDTRIEAGIYQNEYRLDGDRWRICIVRYFPQSSGDYRSGWTNSDDAGLPIIPTHFTPDEAGTPIPDVKPLSSFGSEAPSALATRIDRLNSEDDVRNLQHAWGYYLDRRMWTDAEELFAHDGRMIVNGTAYDGRGGIRRALELMGPEGLSDGVLNDRVVFDTLVQVGPDGQSALSRGIRLGLLADGKGKGEWEFSTFASTVVRINGSWQLREVETTTHVRADYDVGWGDGGATSFGPEVPAEDQRLRRRTRTEGASERSEDARAQVPLLADLERRLARSRSYDAVENISAAYGYHLDDFQWPRMSALFATQGHKQSPFVGYYVGADRILEAATAAHGAPRAADARRERLVVHWRPQNVILVSHDARSATLRTRLFQSRTAGEVLPEWTGLHSGSYANDQAVLEDGTWRLWSVTIDEYYFTTPSWSSGWASALPRASDAPNPPPRPWVDVCPPDIPMSLIGDRARGFRGGPGKTLLWPEIVPMWFHYRNPVSGRVPENYWPDCVPGAIAPELSMSAHGYQLPPTGPATDGLEHTTPREGALP